MTGAQQVYSSGGAKALIERVRKVPQAKAMIRAVASGEKRLHASGLRGSSAVFLIEALREALDIPIVVCCPNEEQARDVLSDFRTVSSTTSLLFPEKDIFPRRLEVRENLSVRGSRNDCLDKICHGEVNVVVTSLLGFLEKTIPPGSLETHRCAIRIGETIDLDELRSWLVGLGYELSTIVEEIGQFAVRGAIVDVFDPSWEHPTRIELFDDEVLTIRAFDIDSQLSIGNLEDITILPIKGIPTDGVSFDALRKRLEQIPVDAERIDKIMGEITHIQHSPYLRQYAPLLGMNGSVLDFFPTPPMLVFLGVEAMDPGLRAIEGELEFLSKQPKDGFPLLDLYEYLNRPDYHESYGISCMYVWDLPIERESKQTVNSRTVKNPGSPGTFAQIHAGEEVFRFQTASHPGVTGRMDQLSKTIRQLRGKGLNVHIYSESAAQRERLADMLEEDEALVHLPVGWVTSGFLWEEAAMAVLTDHEIFNRILPRPRRIVRRRRFKGLKHEHLSLGDFIVHVDYGIGRFFGLEKVRVDGKETECLILRYLGGDRIYVPLDQMHLVEKYVGKEGTAPSIDRLGSLKWQRTKERTKKALEDIAKELLNIYATREIAEGHAFSPDIQWQGELEASFPYEETPHQLRATDDIKKDMENKLPMDRLICGDVGYGKTEVAIRAAFKAVNDGKQVAVLVPTTILAMQHFQTFSDRMKTFPVEVEMLSRFKSPSVQKKIIARLAGGTVDVVVGTHRLLSKDVAFKDLGLVIVDEEHRFGVKSKEKLKQIKRSVDVLSLSATPIPRTLYMALSGLRRISVIDTPPRNRHPVKTEVIPFDEDMIARAILDEIKRGGQVFFVHNRVASIYSMQAFLERLVPDVRFGVAHGQMGERELERVVLSFLENKFDVLISTMIIESGLDFANVDTIIVNRADRFGLAQLYQLRGRVGRRERQAYAYLLIPRYLSLSETARKRLQAMEEFEELGSGYRLAMRDLEIRGAGNVLGVEQHGHMVAVGFDLYCKMLKEAVEKLSGEPKTTIPQCKVEATLKSFLPDWYVEDQDERMALYKRLAGCETLEALNAIELELKDRFGDFPPESRNLLDLTRVKLLATELGIERVRITGSEAVLEFFEGRFLSPKHCAVLAETFQDSILFKSGKAFSVSLRAEAGNGAPGAEGGSGVASRTLALERVKKLLILTYDSDKKVNSTS